MKVILMFHDVEYRTRTCNVHKFQSQDLNGEEVNIINDTHMNAHDFC